MSAAATTIPCVWHGPVAVLAERLRDPGFFTACAERYRAEGFGPAGDGELRSWRNSWPPLVDVLLRAGLGGLWIYLEHGMAGGGMRFDALLLGTGPDGSPDLIVVELKQWDDAEPVRDGFVRLRNGKEFLNPVVQVLGYLAFLRGWVEDGFRLSRIRGVAFLHNASEERARVIWAAERRHAAEVPVIAGDQTGSEVPPRQLARLFLAESTSPPDERSVAEFARARWVPAQSLLSAMADDVENAASFTLAGDQQTAFLSVRRAAQEALRSPGSRPRLIVVTGGPGSGKTVVAIRLFGGLNRRAGVAARFVTPSGTLIAQVRRVLRDAAKNLVLLPTAMLAHSAQGARAMIIDEGQRLKRNQAQRLLGQTVERIPVLVLFLDERQIIRPDEGITVQEAERVAAAHGADFEVLPLSGSFRSNGSRNYIRWVDRFLYETPVRWTGDDFDLAVANDPRELQDWVDRHATADHGARITAGFCWPWARDRRVLVPEVDIAWTDPDGSPRTWSAPWNADEAMRDAPHRNFWATDPGGHRQIGCIYTAQGLEYGHGGVIMGPDLVRRGDAWVARPAFSKDSAMNGISPERYLPLALNIYRVLLTRSTRATRVYSTDPETQRFLNELIGRGVR